MNKQYWVYIAECADKSYYTGVTNNLDRRIYEHNHGIKNNHYTSSRRPIQIVYSVLYFDINQAIAFEKQIKGWSRKKKTALINGKFEELLKLSKRYSPNVPLREPQSDTPASGRRTSS